MLSAGRALLIAVCLFLGAAFGAMVRIVLDARADVLLYPGLGKVEERFTIYTAAKVEGVPPVLHDQTTFSVPATIASGRLTSDGPGTGAGSATFLLCSDGTTCAAGNIYLTCTLACTAAEGVTSTCTVNKASVVVGTVLSWVETVICTQDPGLNIHARITMP